MTWAYRQSPESVETLLCGDGLARLRPGGRSGGHDALFVVDRG